MLLFFFVYSDTFPELTLNAILTLLAFIAMPFLSISEIYRHIKKIKIYNAEIRDQSISNPGIKTKYLVEEYDEINQNIKSRKISNWYFGVIGSIFFIGGLAFVLSELEYDSLNNIFKNSLIFLITIISISIGNISVVIYNILRTLYDKKLLIRNKIELEELNKGTNEYGNKPKGKILDTSSKEEASVAISDEIN